MKERLIELKFGHRNFLIYKMKNDYKFSLRKVGKAFDLSGEQVRLICNNIDNFLEASKSHFLLTPEGGNDKYIGELGLSKRNLNALEKAGIYTVEELKQKSYDDIINLRGIGWLGAQEIFCKVLEVIKNEER